MNKTQKTYLGIALATICFILWMRVWPFELVQNPCENHYQTIEGETSSEYLSASTAVSQVFVTQANYLKQIQIEMIAEQVGENDQVYAVLLDENRDVISEETVSVKKVAKKGYLTLKPDCAISNGVLYTIEIYLEGNDGSTICVKLASTPQLALLEYDLLSVFSEEYVNQESFVANYTYMAPCTKTRMLFYYALIGIAGVAAYFLLTWVISTVCNAKWMRNKKVVICLKAIVSLILFSFAIYATLFAVVWQKFGGYIHDQVIYSLGIWIAGIFLLFMIWKDDLFQKKEAKTEKSEKHPVSILVDYLQMICFGFMFHAAVMYQNAAIMKDQNTNLCWIALLLGLAVFSFQFEKIYFYIEKEWKLWKKDKTEKTGIKKISKNRIFLGVYFVLLIALIAFLVYDAVGYCSSMKGDEIAYSLAVLTKWRDIVWGIVILNTVAFLRPRILKTISIPMVVIWALFAIWIWTHQYNYTYIVGIPVYFSVLLLQDYTRKDYARILENAIHGMIFAFLLNVALSLLHRPYLRMRFYRYQMYFHTVACTGELQIAAFAAVLAQILIKTKNKSLWNATWEIVLLGIIQSYEFMGMARTALLSTVGLVICGMVAAIVLYRLNLKQILTRLLVIFLSMLVTFPTVYSATRMIPALVDDPYRFPIFMEVDFDEGINQGDPIDDSDYMDFIRFLYCLTTRFTLPEGILNWIEDEYREINYVPQSSRELRLASGAVSTDRTVGMQYMVSGHGIRPIISLEVEDDLQEDVSNGRFEIWSYYLADLNMEGHEELSITLEDGEVLVHAHNSFIQMFHSFGYPGGILFMILVLAGLLKSCILIVVARKKKENPESYALYLTSFLIILAYCVASLTEWLSTITIPLALLFWIATICLSRKQS